MPISSAHEPYFRKLYSANLAYLFPSSNHPLAKIKSSLSALTLCHYVQQKLEFDATFIYNNLQLLYPSMPPFQGTDIENVGMEGGMEV